MRYLVYGGLIPGSSEVALKTIRTVNDRLAVEALLPLWSIANADHHTITIKFHQSTRVIRGVLYVLSLF